MAITELNARSDASVASVHESSRGKIIFVASLFVVSLAAFVCQTEFTSQVYYIGFKEPVILLLVTHGSWWLLWPFQALFVSTFRTYGKWKRGKPKVRSTRLDSTAFLLENETEFESPAQSARGPSHTAGGDSEIVETKSVDIWKYFKRCLVTQVHNVYHTAILVYEAQVNDDRSTRHLQALIDQNPRLPSSSSITACVSAFLVTPAFKYIAWKTAMISVVLNVAGFTWYGAMSMTYASDVTAIYNCSAFTAYAFAIPMLNERFSWLKAASVLIAVSGVFVVAYSGSESSEEEAQYPYRLVGNTIIAVGAVLYGYYEVLYKKYVCVPEHLAKVITPRRQSTFANFIMALLGLFTTGLLLVGISVAEIFHIHHFNLFNYGKNTFQIWAYISGSIVSNLLFSASFLSLMALTSPVLSSVSSLLTIFLIGIVEWILFNNQLSYQQLLGDALVIVGFAILTTASWQEISEGKDDDEIDTASIYSYAPSVNTLHNSDR